MTRIDPRMEDLTSYEKWSRKHRPVGPKLDKSTEQKLTTLSSANEKLSRTNLVLTNFLKRVSTFIPAHLKEEYERLRALAEMEDIHPE